MGSESRLAKGALLSASMVVSLAFAEGGLRAAGYGPWQRVDKSSAATVEADAQLGWRNRPDLSLSRQVDGRTLRYTTWPDGSRATALDKHLADKKLVLFGCSFTNGTSALSDDETYAWKVQERLPDWEVINFGTEAYSPYQSELLLEEKLRSGMKPNVVTFGFVTFHESRNVAHPAWLRMLAQANTRLPNLPYVTVDDRGGLIRHPGIEFPSFPLREHFALANQLNLIFATVSARSRIEQATEATHQVLTLMRKTTEAAGARFRILFLHAYQEPKERYLELFQRWQLPVDDCVLPATDGMERYQLRENGHPNELANTRWADCLANALNR